MQPTDDIAMVANGAGRAGILQQRTEYSRRIEFSRRVADNDAPADCFSPCADHRNRLGMAILIDKERRRLQFRHAPRHCHRLRRSGGLVEQRGVGDFQTGEIDNHSLKIQQRLESTLADLWLVWRIGGIPGWIFQDVALNDWRQMRTVITLTDQRDHRPIACCDRAHLCQQFLLG